MRDFLLEVKISFKDIIYSQKEIFLIAVIVIKSLMYPGDSMISVFSA
jgi:hypothetical protein